MIYYDFTGKTVLVTGSSRGMGAFILERFAVAGAKCWLHFWDDPAVFLMQVNLGQDNIR